MSTIDIDDTDLPEYFDAKRLKRPTPEDQEFERIQKEIALREKLLDEYRSGLDSPPE